MSGAKIIEALKEAIDGNLARVTVEGQTWVRRDEIENYEKSYTSLWGEIERARRERDNAKKMIDVARDLVIAIEHDLRGGTTVVSLKTHDTFNRLRSRLADYT
jgi:hypothetical protein